jgi:Trk-type K+ transport system membrane component
MKQYIFLCQILPFAILSIYFTVTTYWSSAFQASAGIQTTTVHPVWASLYFASSAYSGAGLSLTDQSVLPFANCYLLIWVLNFTMLLGNHAFPMTLRFLIWLGTKITSDSTLHQTLHFLLDHPRRLA